MAKIELPIRGMHCKSCEIMIEKHLKKLREVREVEISFKDGIAHITCAGGVPSDHALERAIRDAGYEIGEKEQLAWISTDFNDYIKLFWAAAILGMLYYAARGVGLFDLNVDTSNMGLFVVLMVGLVAGISTCMALVGGLVLGLSARHAETHPEATVAQKFRPHLYFNLGRVAGYGVLGGIIGMIGSAVTPSAKTLGIMTVVVGAVMVFLGLKLIEIFPVLRDKTIALPKEISRWLGLQKESHEYSHKSALVTGALTFFLPCGFTQAMQLYAVSTGSFAMGAAVMATFALGTAPGLMGIGYLSSAFKGQKARMFFMIAGLAVILLGGINISNGSQLMEGPVATVAQDSNAAPSADAQEVRMTEDSYGYSPKEFTVQKGRPVKWIIDAKNIYTCASQIVMPKMGIQKNLESGENVITFTPTEIGKLPFSCSMGMYRGVFNVVDDTGAAAGPAPTANLALAGNTGNLFAAAPAQPAAQPPAAGGSCGSGGGGCGCGGGRAAAPIVAKPADPNLDLSNAQTIESVFTQADGITPNEFTVKKDQPVKWTIKLTEPPVGCMRAIVIRELGVYEPQPDSGTMTVVFNPTASGDYRVTCGMGMYRGTIHVS